MPIKPLPKPKPKLVTTDDKPVYVPPHPAFVGKADVLTKSAHLDKLLDGAAYQVDLGAGTCTCPNGKPFQWHFKQERWVPNFACSHKIRMMSDILDKAGRPVDMQIAYSKTVAARYNMYEVVSAFHKELRRGNIEHAVFWGVMLANFRGIKGVIKYMLNILYEETRDHGLGDYLLQPSTDDFEKMLYGIAMFCKSKKKWELPHRMKFLEAEMRGYALLIQKYGRDVAQGGGIIAASHRDHLMAEFKLGLRKRDLVKIQYGLKGLQKTKTTNIDAHRAWVLNETLAFVKDHEGAERLTSYIQRRSDAKLGIGYHELNMFVDFVCGEPLDAGLSNYARVLKAKPPQMRLGVAPTIPIYAQDNHTWAGKALIRQFPAEFQPGAKQEHYDLRLCGAYMGVVYRHLAMQQHGQIDCEWQDVRWPTWLHETVSNLWY